MPEINDAMRNELTNHANAIGNASQEIARQMAVLWQARLNMALATDDPVAVRRMLSEVRAERYMDNCNCGGGGGTQYLD